MDNYYTKRLIVFVDILGFKDKVKESVFPREQFDRINKALRRIHKIKEYNYSKSFMNRQGDGFEVTTFSDNAVISCPACNDNLFFLTLELIHLQLDLVPLGILLRGGITIGDLYHDRDVVFGSAMNEAYYIETKVAVYPRIVIRKSALDQCFANVANDEELIGYMKSLIRRDLDDMWFIDFLKQSSEMDEPADYYEWLLLMRDCIFKGLTNEDLSVQMKYQWLRLYFNEVVCDDNLNLIPEEEITAEMIEYRNKLKALKINDV